MISKSISVAFNLMTHKHSDLGFISYLLELMRLFVCHPYITHLFHSIMLYQFPAVAIIMFPLKLIVKM